MALVSTIGSGNVNGVLLSVSPNSHVTIKGSAINAVTSTGAPHPCSACPPSPVCPTVVSAPTHKVKIKGNSIIVAGDPNTCGVHNVLESSTHLDLI